MHSFSSPSPYPSLLPPFPTCLSTPPLHPSPQLLPPLTQAWLDLDLASATGKAGEQLFPHLVGSRRRLKLWPGSLCVTADNMPGPEPVATATSRDSKPQAAAMVSSDPEPVALTPAAVAELSSAQFELYCGERVGQCLVALEPVNVSMKLLCDSGLTEAASFLEHNKLLVQARRTRGNPVAELLTAAGKPFEGRLPADVLAQLRRHRFCTLATDLLDQASLAQVGFCSIDVKDPRFLFNRLAPPSATGITSASAEVDSSHCEFVRLVRVAHGSEAWRKLHHHGTRVDATNAISRAIERIAHGRVWLRYIADY